MKSWRAKNKGVSLKDSMKRASSEYRKSTKSEAPKAKKKDEKSKKEKKSEF